MTKFTGAEDLSNDGYRIFLSKKYSIQKNELFDKFETDNKLFDTLNEALVYAHECELAQRDLSDAVCPNCNSQISSNAVECPLCKASFGELSKWRPVLLETREGQENYRCDSGVASSQPAAGNNFIIFLLFVVFVFAIGMTIYTFTGNSKQTSQTPTPVVRPQQKSELTPVEMAGICAGFHTFWSALSTRAGKSLNMQCSLDVMQELNQMYPNNVEFNRASRNTTQRLLDDFQKNDTSNGRPIANVCTQIGITTCFLQ